MPECCSVATMRSRLARVSAMGRPRRPSLPPNSTTATAGCRARTLGEALDAVLGGVAADALVVDAVADVALVEEGLEVVGIALAGADAGAGGEAVAEADQDGAVVCVRSCGGRCLGWAEAERVSRRHAESRERINFPHRSNVSKMRVHRGDMPAILIDVTQKENCRE